MEISMDLPRPYSEWRTDTDGRWRDAFHSFGHLLLTHARDGAINNTRSEHQDVASTAATDALYNFMMILEGVVGVPAADDRRIEFALVARVRETSTKAVIEQFELAPDGRGCVKTPPSLARFKHQLMGALHEAIRRWS